MNASHLDKRIEAIQDTVKRTRSALLICVLASGAMILCLWNTYASWDRDFAFLNKDDYKQAPETSKSPDASNGSATAQRPGQLRPKGGHLALAGPYAQGARNRFTQGAQASASPAGNIQAAWENKSGLLPPYLMDQQMRSWIDTQVVSVALLGIKISVSDFAIMGSFALALCIYYLFLCTRRENHEIGYLFQDIASPVQMGLWGYHAFAVISSLMVFNLSGLHSKVGFTDVIRSRTGPNEASRTRSSRGAILAASILLYLLPSITMLFAMTCDFGWAFGTLSPSGSTGHLFFVSPFRTPGFEAPYFRFDSGERHYFWVAEGIAGAMVLILGLMSILIMRYEQGTRRVLDQVYVELTANYGIPKRFVESQVVARSMSEPEPAPAVLTSQPVIESMPSA